MLDPSLELEVATLLAKGAIKPIDPLTHPRGFYSAYFLVWKKTDGYCLVLNLRGLNRFLKVFPLHMGAEWMFFELSLRGERSMSVDLKDTCFHIPIVLHLQFTSRHVSVLELQAMHMVVRHFLPYLRGKHVLVQSDNTSTAYHMNHQGGTRSAWLLQVSRGLLMWAATAWPACRQCIYQGRGTRLQTFITSHHPEVVYTIWSLFGRAKVNLFASEALIHCPFGSF